MDSRATANRTRKVNRTIEVLNLNVTAVDLDEKVVVELHISIPAVGFRSDKAMENAIVAAVAEKGNYKYVTHTITDKTFITYTMSEAFFIANAKITATGNDIKNMQPVSLPDETETETESTETEADNQ